MKDCPLCGGEVSDGVCEACGYVSEEAVYGDSRDGYADDGKHPDDRRNKDLSSAIITLRSAQLYDRNREDMLSTLHQCLSVLNLPVRLEMDTDIDLTDKEKELVSMSHQLIERCDTTGFITIQRPEIYIRMGNAFFADGDNNKALSYYDKVTRDYPRNKDALFNKALTLFSMGKYDKSLQLLDKLLKIEPELQHATILKELVKQMDM